MEDREEMVWDSGKVTLRAVLFDLDGVLVDAKEWHYLALNEALGEVAGTTITRSEHLTVFDAWPTRTKLAKLVEMGRVLEAQVQAIVQAKQRYTIRAIEGLCVPDVTKVRLVTELRRRGVKLACVSNAVRQSVLLMLDLSHLLPFDVVVSNEDVANPKPAPDGYLAAMLCLGVRAAECIAVEDHEKGVAAARAAGLRCLHLQYPEVTFATLNRLVELPRSESCNY